MAPLSFSNVALFAKPVSLLGNNCRPATLNRLNLVRSLSLVQHTGDAQNKDLRITFFVNKFNSLSQRVYLELEKRGHAIKVYEVDKDHEMDNKQIQEDSDIIIAPFLTKRIPENIWKSKETPCLVVHPGLEGDRGMYAIDWALQKKLPEWGVTVLHADEEMDMGDIWSTNNFSTHRPDINSLTKSSVYQNEVTEKAVKGVLEAIDNFKKNQPARPLDYSKPTVKGNLHAKMVAKDRTISWDKSADEIATIVRMCDSQPGAIATFNGVNGKFRVFGAHLERGRDLLSFPDAKPGDIVGHRSSAILTQTAAGLLWLSHLKQNKLKLPATLHLPQKFLSTIPELDEPIFGIPHGTYPQTYREIWTTVSPEGVGYVHYNFYNGAMNTSQCKRLVEAIHTMRDNDRVKLVVFMGGHNYFSNGIHLNVIEHSPNPVQESWENINAINDVVKAMFTMPKMTVSAVNGNAGAGGCMMALASNLVWAKKGAIMNPSYKSMNLYGSEYHTYFLPKRVGKKKAQELLSRTEPLHSSDALQMGMFDKVMGDSVDEFRTLVQKEAKQLASVIGHFNNPQKVSVPSQVLESHRNAELNQMRINFTSQDYMKARRAFVRH